MAEKEQQFFDGKHSCDKNMTGIEEKHTIKAGVKRKVLLFRRVICSTIQDTHKVTGVDRADIRRFFNSL